MAGKSIKVKLNVDSRTGQANIKKVSKDVSRLERQTNKSTSSMSAGFKKLAGPVAIGAVLIGFTKMLSQTVKLGDKFHKLNLKLGVSVETLSKLEHIANLSGVSFTIVTSSIERMQRRIGLATRGLGAAKKAFEELNIDVEALSKLNPEEQFLQLAEASLKIENPIKRAGVQFELFGMTAAELNKMLPGLRDKLSKTGAAITDAQAKTFAEYTDTMTEMKKNLDTIKFSVFGKIAEGMNQIFEASTRERNATLAETSQRITEIGNAMFSLATATEDAESKEIAWQQAQAKKYGVAPLRFEFETMAPLPGMDLGQLKDTSELERLRELTKEKLQIVKDFQDKQLAAKQQFRTQLYEMDKSADELDRERIQANYDYMIELGFSEVEAAKVKAAAIKEIEDKAAAKTTGNLKKKMQSMSDFVGSMSSLFSEFNNMMGTFYSDSENQSRSDFERQKKFNIAQANMSTAAAVTKALDTYPPGAPAIVKAALIMGAGQVQIARIHKQEYAKGGAFTNSVVSSPTQFNIGEMGEAGPEAILPLTKTAGGELGVKSQGSGQTIIIHNHVSAMDSESFANFTRRNPGAMVAPIIEQMQRGNQALNNTMRKVNQ